MNNVPEEDKILLSGRLFSQQELEDIIYIVRRFPKLSCSELAMTICEGLPWVAPNGKYKTQACLQLLEKLSSQGKIFLPPKRQIRSSEQKPIVATPITETAAELTGSVGDYRPIELESVRGKESIALWNEYIERYHVLGYKCPFGAHQRYFIWSGNEPKQRLGCLLFSASSWALAERDKWISWNKEDRSQRLHLIVNNTRFLIFPWVKIKNLASKALSLARQQILVDWRERYGFEPVLLETFVDIELYKGTCYQADNWVYLGETKGRGRMDRYTQYLSSPKRIYMYPLYRDFRAILCGKSGDAQ